MLTLLAQHNSWPNHLHNFFIFNVLLHAVNVLLVFIVSYYLSFFYLNKNEKDTSSLQTKIFFLALATALFWGILPLQVSSSLIAIQRMTTLSAFFMLLGLFFYLKGLTKQYNAVLLTGMDNNNNGFYYQLFALIFATLLAIFSKENGILLPIFILTLEITILNGLSELKYRKNLRLFAGFVALILILGYLTYYVITQQADLAYRDFSVLTRLKTEAIILFDYLRLAFIPNIYEFNPFHDNYPVVKQLDFYTILAATFWPLSFIFAVIYRKKLPLLAFAILWFLTGHLIESSVISLELYFEHRNYLALFGVCFAIVLSFAHLPQKYKKGALAGFFIYMVIQGFLLFNTTSLWGQQNKSAQAWYLTEQQSIRASEFLSGLYLENNQLPQALAILEHHAKVCAECTSTKARVLLIQCDLKHKNKTVVTYKKLMNMSSTSTYLASTPAILSLLYKEIKNGSCSDLSINQLKALNNKLLTTTQLNSDQKLELITNLHQIAMHQGDQKENIRLLLLAWQEKHDTGLAQVIITHLLAAKMYDKAEHFVKHKLCTHTEFNPLKNKAFVESCQRAQQRISAIKTK